MGVIDSGISIFFRNIIEDLENFLYFIGSNNWIRSSLKSFKLGKYRAKWRRISVLPFGDHLSTLVTG